MMHIYEFDDTRCALRGITTKKLHAGIWVAYIPNDLGPRAIVIDRSQFNTQSREWMAKHTGENDNDTLEQKHNSN